VAKLLAEEPANGSTSLQENNIKLLCYQGYTAAQLATEPVAKLLAEEPANGGIDIEYQLLEAAKAGDLELVRKIVGLHPHIVNCRDLDGRHSTPLHFAAGHLPCFVFF
jgi:tankyrase